MAHDHGHGEAHARGKNQRALAIVLALTATFTVVEVVGGLLTGSLALLADAGHMLSDNFSIGLALFASWVASKPPTPNRSFGFKRAEILAALVNGVALVAVSLWILFEAFHRLQDPPQILAGPMLLVAAGGLLVNVAGAVILSRSGAESLNVQGALRHLLADLLGSVGAISAALMILLTGWRYADPAMSVLIALLVLASSWQLLRESTAILLEEAPSGLDVNEVGVRMVGVSGVREVHDLHVWTITSGFPSLSAHVLVGEDEDCHALRRDLERLLSKEFGIEHTTLQVDHVGDHATNDARLQFLPRAHRPRGAGDQS